MPSTKTGVVRRLVPTTLACLVWTGACSQPTSEETNGAGGSASGGAEGASGGRGGAGSGGSASGGRVIVSGGSDGESRAGGSDGSGGGGGDTAFDCGSVACPDSIIEAFESDAYAGVRRHVSFLTEIAPYDRSDDRLSTSYDDWSEQTSVIPNRPQFREALEAAWEWIHAPNWNTDFAGQPSTIMTERGGVEAVSAEPSDQPRYRLPLSDGWAAYIAWAAHSVALDHSGRLPWSLQEFLDEDESWVRTVLSSAEMMTRREFEGLELRFTTGYHNNFIGLPFTEYLGTTIPAMPRYTLAFLSDAGLVGDTPRETIESLVDWSRRLVHFYGAQTREVAQEHWGHPFPPTVQHLVEGTVRVGETEERHWTLGCHGTAGFWKAVLRAVNLPVRIPALCKHATAYFPTEGLFIDHGDDPYILNFAESLCPVSKLMIDESTFFARFVFDTNHADAAVCESAVNPIALQVSEENLDSCVP